MSSPCVFLDDHRVYFDTELQTPALRVAPAEYRVSDHAVALVTLLGSCVAACIYDPYRKVGGMNHFLLPDAVPQHLPNESARYGAHAMELLINALLKRGAQRGSLVAKVFGGGNVLMGMSSQPIGTRNANFVVSYLQAEGIPIVSKDLEGVQPRKICFFPQSGRVLVKHLPAAREVDIAEAERALYGRITTNKVGGSVELF